MQDCDQGGKTSEFQANWRVQEVCVVPAFTIVSDVRCFIEVGGTKFKGGDEGRGCEGEEGWLMAVGWGEDKLGKLMGVDRAFITMKGAVFSAD